MRSNADQAPPLDITTRRAGRAGNRNRAPSPAEQRTARIMGAWFLGTFVFSIPALWFYEPILGHARYVVGRGADTRVAVGALLEVLLAICGIATAVVIHPVARRVSDSMALGYVACRTVESVLIVVGVVSLMSVVALRQHLAAAGATSTAVEVARSLLAVHHQTALLGPQLCAGLGNGILLGYLMWRSELLPRPLVMIGLIGGPLAFLGGIGVLLGAWDNPSGPLSALTALEVVWEFSLTVWLLVRGFRPSPILTGAAVEPASEHR